MASTSRKARGLSRPERLKRKKVESFRCVMRTHFAAAFMDIEMLENAKLVVWTKGQMRGIRSVIRRLGLAEG